ncbi:hypothetical protein JNO04_10855 [Halomonas sp. MC140]|nr:hypothetical protein [Halomonas sp. MC140]MDN7132847.1 hypothetical protein [Halomonas sp. MC140]
MSQQVSKDKDYAGLAALAICESLLLAMNDHQLLSEKEIIDVLKDAANTHENAVGLDEESETHVGVAALINAIISGGNSVRRL